MDSRKYRHAGLGGTFDRLHAGHIELIQTALNVADTISIGITVDNFANHKKMSHIIESHVERKKAVEARFSNELHQGRIKVFALEDEFGPTLTDDTIDCLVVTNHTIIGAKHINQSRVVLGKQKLPVIIATLIEDETGVYISSTRIRLGKINRVGFVYEKLMNNDVTLNAFSREKLQERHGEIVTNSWLEKNAKHKGKREIFVVGDQVLATFVQDNLFFNVGIYDLRTRRMATDMVERAIVKAKIHFQNTISVTNPKGTLSRHAVGQINLLSQREFQLVKVVGEEDMLAVACILVMPLGSYIFYGQPDEGIVKVEVTEAIKEKMRKIVGASLTANNRLID